MAARTAIVKSFTVADPPNIESAKWWLEHYKPETYNLKYIKKQTAKAEEKVSEEIAMDGLLRLADKYCGNIKDS